MSKIIIFLINLYQRIPGNFHNYCKFTPSCSEYSKQAYRKFGFFKGTKLTIKRLLKCRPFGKVGYDPIPKE